MLREGRWSAARSSADSSTTTTARLSAPASSHICEAWEIVLEVKGPARPEQMSDTGSPRSRVVPLMVLDRVRDVCSRRNWLASEECRELAALI
jgi:hypothetical protein